MKTMSTEVQQSHGTVVWIWWMGSGCGHTKMDGCTPMPILRAVVTLSPGLATFTGEPLSSNGIVKIDTIVSSAPALATLYYIQYKIEHSACVLFGTHFPPESPSLFLHASTIGPFGGAV